jgi:hypothetical protein
MIEMNLSLHEHRVSQGADPYRIVAWLIREESRDVVPFIGQALSAPSSRRDVFKRVAGAVGQSAILHAVGPALAIQGVQAAAKAMTPAVKPKEVVPEFKGQPLHPHVVASAAHNVMRKDAGESHISAAPEDFDASTHRTVKAPHDFYGTGVKKGDDTSMEVNPEGHPINKKAYTYDVAYHDLSSKGWLSAHEREWSLPHGEWEKRQEAAKLHQDIHYAKADDGVIAYENPFHDKHKFSLETGVKAVHVHDKTGEVRRFKVPIDFDADELRYPNTGIGSKEQDHIRGLVTQHYNTRVNPASAAIDFSVHRKLLRSHGFHGGLGSSEKGEWSVGQETPDNAYDLMTHEEKYGSPHGFMTHHGFKLHGYEDPHPSELADRHIYSGGSGFSGGYSHPMMPGKMITTSTEGSQGHREHEHFKWSVNKYSGPKPIYAGSRSVEPGWDEEASGQGYKSFQDHLKSQGVHVPSDYPSTEYDPKRNFKLNIEVPDRIKRYTKVMLGRVDKMDPTPHRGWIAYHVNPWRREEEGPYSSEAGRGETASELHDFLTKNKEGWKQRG